MEVGRTYLLFLNYKDAARCFRIAKVWEIRDGKAFANAYDDLRRVHFGQSSFQGATEDAAITAVNSLVEKEGKE